MISKQTGTQTFANLPRARNAQSKATRVTVEESIYREITSTKEATGCGLVIQGSPGDPSRAHQRSICA